MKACDKPGREQAGAEISACCNLKKGAVIVTAGPLLEALWWLGIGTGQKSKVGEPDTEESYKPKERWEFLFEMGG